MPDWIERQDHKLLTQSAAFSQGVGEHWAAYGVSEQDAAELADRQAAYAAARALAVQPTTNSDAAVHDKSLTRVALVDVMRRVARVIRARPGLPAELLNAVGFRPPEPRRRRVGGPRSAPHVQVVGVEGRVVTVRLVDPAHPFRKARPRDTIGAAVFGFAGEEHPAGREGWIPFGNRSLTTFTVDFNGADVASGAKIWVGAAWIGTRQQLGPPSIPAYAYVSGRPAFKLKVLRAA